MRYIFHLLASLIALVAASPAYADELFVGAYVHEVDTPFTLKVAEAGAGIALGYRFKPIESWHAIGKPAPYVVASINTAGDTSFAGVGLSWTMARAAFTFVPRLASSSTMATTVVSSL